MNPKAKDIFLYSFFALIFVGFFYQGVIGFFHFPDENVEQVGDFCGSESKDQEERPAAEEALVEPLLVKLHNNIKGKRKIGRLPQPNFIRMSYSIWKPPQNLL